MKGRPPRYALLAEASTAGLLFPLSIVAGYELGKWIGEFFHRSRPAALLGALLGVAAAFWNLFRFLRRLDSQPKEKT